MKKTFALLVIFLWVGAQAQFRINNDKPEHLSDFDEQKFSYGYFLGVNYFDFKIHPDQNGMNDLGRFNVTSEGSMGFSAGLMGKMKLNNHFDLILQPGIHFTERTLTFDHIREGQNYAAGDTLYTAVAGDSIRTVKSSYIEIPLLIQLHGNRWHNTRPYIQAGVGYMINLQSEEGTEDDNSSGIFRTKTHNFNWQVEAGINIYFRRFRLTPSVKGVFFFNNELVADNPGTADIWAGALKSVTTRAIMFSIKFE